MRSDTETAEIAQETSHLLIMEVNGVIEKAATANRTNPRKPAVLDLGHPWLLESAQLSKANTWVALSV